MQYEPIKKALGRFFSGPSYMRKSLYFLMDLILLRAWHVRKALKKISRELPDHALILDAGSGMGQYSYRLSRMSKNWQIKGVDVNETEIGDCNSFFRKTGLSDRVSFETADLTTLKEPSVYDLIITVDVMEHIREDVTVFKNFYNCLNNNGILLISTPSDQGGSDTHHDSEESFIDEHVRNGYSIAEITGKLKDAGFTKTEAVYTYGKPGNLSWKLSMKYPVKLLNISYLFFIVLPFYFVIILPVSVLLNISDLCIKHKKGTGLLITARK